MNLQEPNPDNFMQRPSFRVSTGENDRTNINPAVRRKNRSTSLHANAVNSEAWNNPNSMEALDAKPKRKSQKDRGPGLREMLYGMAARREKEEAALKKRQKKQARNV
uniref:Uncharacterized protein n=1 Tax=Rhabditophanes sp. KR3021 TaxID=114890 RepID=A0AC35U3V7_9BILA